MSDQVGTHADSLIAEAVLKGFTDFDLDLAWEAVHKDATVPPVDDWAISCVTLLFDLLDPCPTAATDIMTVKRCAV